MDPRGQGRGEGTPPHLPIVGQLGLFLRLVGSVCTPGVGAGDFLAAVQTLAILSARRGLGVPGVGSLFLRGGPLPLMATHGHSREDSPSMLLPAQSGEGMG